MTSKEALDKIKYIDIDGRYPYPNFLKDDVKYKEIIEVIEKRLNELEKRDTPMKVNKVDVTPLAYYYYYCKACHVSQGSSEVDRSHKHFCYNCGQRLDWS